MLALITQRPNVMWTRIHFFETLLTGVPIFLTQTALFYLHWPPGCVLCVLTLTTLSPYSTVQPPPGWLSHCLPAVQTEIGHVVFM